MRRTGTVFLLLLILFLPISASADTGPKPSVRIAFTGGEGLTFYGTLLSRYDSTGPASAWNGQEEYASYHPGEEGYEVWRKFVDYKDADGFYFLQEWWDCSENQALNWIYYPPSTFKILLYFPDSDTFCISPVYEKYASPSGRAGRSLRCGATTIPEKYLLWRPASCSPSHWSCSWPSVSATGGSVFLLCWQWSMWSPRYS